jgi:WD40 repeat protein
MFSAVLAAALLSCEAVTHSSGFEPVVVTSVAFAPDGTSVLTWHNDGRVRLWKLGRDLRVWRLGEDAPIKWGGASWVGDAQAGVLGDLLGFSEDGKLVLSRGKDKLLRVWNVAANKIVCSLKGLEGEPVAHALSPDGKYVLLACWGEKAQLWNATTGKLVRNLVGHTNLVGAVAISPDSKFGATGSRDGTVKIWDADTGKNTRTFVGCGWVSRVTFSPDSKWALVAGGHRGCTLWNLATGRLGQTIGQFPEEDIDSVAFSPTGHFVLSAGVRGIRLWEIGTGKLALTFEDGNYGSMRQVAISSDGKRALSLSNGHIVTVWDTRTGAEICTLTGPPSAEPAVYSAVFSPDGKSVLSGGEDGRVRLWKVASGKLGRTFEDPQLSAVEDRWEAPKAPARSHFLRVRCVAFSPNGQIALTWDQCVVKLWAVENGKLLRTIKIADENILSAAAVSRDGKLLAIGTNETLEIWDAHNGHRLRVLTKEKADVWDLAFGHDGKLLVSAGPPHGFQVWDAAARCVLKTPTARLRLVALSSSRRFALFRDGKSLLLWDLVKEEEVSSSRAGGQQPPEHMALSSDGMLAVSALPGCEASPESFTAFRLWQPRTGKQLRLLSPKGVPEQAHAVAFSPDGRFVLVAGKGNLLKLLDVSAGSEVRSFRLRQ